MTGVQTCALPISFHALSLPPSLLPPSYPAMSDRRRGSLSPPAELRLILLGNLGCGKTLSADTILGQASATSPSGSSRVCQLRRGTAEGRRVAVVEAPRWYWSRGNVEADVRKETERALMLAAPGPHAILLLVPVGQFTEVGAYKIGRASCRERVSSPV